jgi:nucleoside-diphosphate-sugar epimerase
MFDESPPLKILITGGAGFIGRWVVKAFLERGCEVWVLDNLSNGSEENVAEFRGRLNEFIVGDVRDKRLLNRVFRNRFDACVHAAAAINVQDSINDPRETFATNVVATFHVLEEATKANTKLVFISSALVYKEAEGKAIDEKHPVKPTSPYVASKIAGENIVLSHYYAYGFPVVVLRPFSVYGPYQRSDTKEGGVMSIFIDLHLKGEDLEVFGDGTQTRDFFYAEDCADFVVRATLSDKANGQILNAGSDQDISIKRLAMMIAQNASRIKHVSHHHPQSEVRKLVSDSRKARELLGWVPTVGLEDGIRRTEEWIRTQSLSNST